MNVLFFIGLVVLILGIVSLVVPIPHSEREGISVLQAQLLFATTTGTRESSTLN
jgi:hypothetical protein